MMNWHNRVLSGVSTAALVFASQPAFAQQSSSMAPLPTPAEQAQPPAPESNGQVQAPASETPVPQAAVPARETTSPDDQPSTAKPDVATTTGDAGGDDIVVTGIRSSLERAAEIKKSAIQVVDSIVAQDIGKFPDPTTAAALQRVPGVQVQYDRGNELGNVRIRGLPDVLTTVNGREVFTTTARNFNLQDLPAEALARVDVVKSQTADLIEGGLAGNIDLQLNKPFNFRKPTFVLNARGNYGVRVNEINPQFGALATTRFNTGLGEMGILVNATWSKTYSYQPESTEADPRTTATAPLNTQLQTPATNAVFPSIFQNISQSGQIWHAQVNAAYQWQISPALEAYVDGFYTSSVNKISYSGGGNVQPFTTGTSISNIVTSPDECFTFRYNKATGQNAAIVTDSRTQQRYFVAPPAVAGGAQPDNYTVSNLCLVKSATLNNVVINQTTHSDSSRTRNKSIAGGFKYDQDGNKANFDVAYQTSKDYTRSVTADVGQRLPTVLVETDVDDGPQLTIPGTNLDSRDALYLRNSISQNYQLSTGHLFAAELNGSHDFDSILKKMEFGLRFADRAANFQQYNVVSPIPFGNLGTANENGNATTRPAQLVNNLPLPSNFLEFGPPAPAINGGRRFLVPSVGFLADEDSLDILRGIFGLPLGFPSYQPQRTFIASEKIYTAYGQANYAIPLFGDAVLDGVIGARLTEAKRSLDYFNPVTANGATTYVPTSSGKKDVDILPNASARLDLQNGLQIRATYAKTIRRPNFTNLNPSLNLTLSANPFLVNNGSSGNPDLRPQKSDSYDASVEYYFKSGYLAVTGYYRNIIDRVITSPATETYQRPGSNPAIFDDYSVSRPRNVGKAELKGVEVSGQAFFDFLPGAFSGFGAFGAFTYADTLIKGDDPLAGNPLQGVSKYNYTAGVLYDKYGISGRVVYTYRSESWQEDQTAGLALRPLDPARASDVNYNPGFFRWLRPNGRLDFSLGYDLSDRARVDIGGTNILRATNKTYWGDPAINSQILQIETTYTVGVRLKF